MLSGVNYLVSELKRLDALVDARNYADARKGLVELLAEARRRSINSAQLHWLLGVASDHEGDLQAAVHHIREALRLDPLCLPFHHSREIVHARLVGMLHDPQRPPDAEDTPALYDALKLLGPVAGETHLVMARYLQTTGELSRALELTRAVLLLDESPAAAELVETLTSNPENVPLGLSPPARA
jgi:tetratricopeptide (TPR) repeat protein